MNEAAVRSRGVVGPGPAKVAALAALRAARLVGVVRLDDADAAREAALALIRGGIGCVEITLTTPGALALIENLSERYRDDPAVLIGAGTVLTPDLARGACDAGARFLVAPVAPDIAPVAREYGAATILGALTPTEILAALDRGSDLVKIFPITAMGGASYIRDIRAPLPNLPLWAAGGTTIADTPGYLAAGAQVVGLAGCLFPPAAVRAGDWAAIEGLARQAAGMLNAEL
jgi:2-dehydro-3-deoxyphosphogluconate aldolase/(4S)-4-hydroxy-2-oxoglutarate aldolase